MWRSCCASAVMVWIVGIVFVGPAYGARVLVTSTGSDTLDTEMIVGIEAYGHDAVLGSQYIDFDGSVNLSNIDTVLLLTNYNWNSGDMPAAGQTSLLNFVNSGGGLVTGEWLVWKHAAQSTFSTLYDAIPIVSDFQFVTNGGVDATTYTRATPSAVLNAGLTDTISFTADSFSGTETKLQPKPGATVFYHSNFSSGAGGGEGLIGWAYGDGRVLSYSTTIGSGQVAHPGFGRLLSNSLSFAAGDGVLVVLGDLNGDGQLDAFDVAPFEQALADRAAYEAAYPGLDADVLGDLNGSGSLDAFDVAPFEAALAGGATTTVPEPGTVGLVVLMGAGSMCGRWRQ